MLYIESESKNEWTNNSQKQVYNNSIRAFVYLKMTRAKAINTKITAQLYHFHPHHHSQTHSHTLNFQHK